MSFPQVSLKNRVTGSGFGDRAHQGGRCGHLIGGSQAVEGGQRGDRVTGSEVSCFCVHISCWRFLGLLPLSRGAVQIQGQKLLAWPTLAEP